MKSEFWTLTIAGAFQHSGVYKKDIPECERNEFKEELRAFILELEEKYKSGSVSEQDHIENIKSIQKWEFKKKDILTNGHLNFGISQKILNLHLKYQWCMGSIPTPPHFPVDRLFQIILDIPEKDIKPWTQMENETDYNKIIELTKSKIGDNSSIAIYELENWNKHGKPSKESDLKHN